MVLMVRLIVGLTLRIDGVKLMEERKREEW